MNTSASDKVSCRLMAMTCQVNDGDHRNPVLFVAQPRAHARLQDRLGTSIGGQLQRLQKAS